MKDIIEVPIFNASKKHQFLNQFENTDTREVYNRIFKKSFELETKYNIDIYNFSDEEFEEFLSKYLKPKTKESARTYCNVLSSYVQWAIDNGDSKHTINPIRRRQEYFYGFVQESKLYFTYDEKEAILYGLKNRQDQFVVQGLWEGIQGNKVCELTHLRIDDISRPDCVIQLRNEHGEATRTIVVEVKTVELAILANREPEYYKQNGNVDYSPKVKEVVDLPLRSEYVLKSALTNNNKDGEEGGQPVSHYTVYNRLEMIKSLEEFQEDYADALSTKNIVRSGMIYMGMKILKRDGVLGRNQIEEICERFNLKYKWSVRDFINEDMIKSMYPEEFAV